MKKFYGILSAYCILVFLLLQLLHSSLLFFSPHFVERIIILVLCSMIVIITFPFIKKRCLREEIDAQKKAVLITGCDSGFGHLLAQRLDRKGFKVFASCLFPNGSGANELKTILSDHSKIFGLDVTKEDSIQYGLKFVKQNLESYELWAIVNNAGIYKGFSFELSNTQDFEECMDVNALGHVRVTKAFLDLLRPSKGRIINVNSVSSRLAISGFFPYCMSKHAAAGFNDCLRVELAHTGIKVISIEATAFLTPMTEPNSVKNNLEEKIVENEEEIEKTHGKGYIENYKKFLDSFLRKTSKDVVIAINDLEHAICSHYPESVYSTCPSIFTAICIKIQILLPAFIQDFFHFTIPKLSCKPY